MSRNDDSVGLWPGAFSVSITNNPAHIIRFDQGEIYFGNRCLTVEEQKKLLTEFENAYRDIRSKNHAWRFLSACHEHFNGQLTEIKTLKTDEQKIRYLFCHAEKNLESKTTEALRKALPPFCDQPRNPVSRAIAARLSVAADLQSEYVRKKTTHFMPEPTYQKVQTVSEKTLISRSRCHDRHLLWMEEAFRALWRFDSIRKTASVTFDARYSKYYLFFYDDCRTAILKSNLGFFARYNPRDTTIEREIAEAEWGRKLYDSLDCFRRRVNKSDGNIGEINSAFNELIEALHKDPDNLVSAHIKDSDFHDAVINLRLQSIVIHIDWRKSVDADEVEVKPIF